MDQQQDAQPAERPQVILEGEQVALGPLRRDLVPLYQRWMNDIATGRNLGNLPPQTLEQEIRWYEEAAASATGRTFTVYERATWRPIGNVGLMGIDFQHGRAEFGILIGEQSCRGKGYGTEATRLVLDYAFTALGLHNVQLRVFSFNHAAIRAYQKAGFREFGRRHACYRFAGRRWDDVHMEALADGFASPVLLRQLGMGAPG